MNALAPADDQVPSTLGLIDVWEVLNPEGTAEAGYTWGYQPPRRYPPGRLDKVLCSGKLTPTFIERFGVGQSIEYRWKDVWLSDHYGLMTHFIIG
jgi:tyrosyl-DNA phosphodiesterase 2